MPSASAHCDVGNFTAEDIEKQKKKYFKLLTAPLSELPFRVSKRKTGVILASFVTEDEAIKFVKDYPVSKMM